MTKFTRWYKELILPAGLLASLIIGAGMFALPYLFNAAGILTGIFYLLIAAVVFTLVHLRYSEIIGQTSGKHRFAGYAGIYLGKWGFRAGALVSGSGLILTLVAYLALGPIFLRLLFPNVGDLLSLYLFWGAGAAAILISLKRLKHFEFLLTLGQFFIIAILFIFGLKRGASTDLSLIKPAFILLPYGAILFALSGRPAISSLRDYFEENKLPSFSLKKAIVLGTALPAFFYFLFALGVISLSPGGASPDSLSGLLLAPLGVITLVGVLGILTIWDSYFLLGLEARDIFRYDFKFPLSLAVATVLSAPLVLYLLGLRNFIGLVSIIGGVFLAAESIMVMLMYGKLGRKNNFGEVLLIIVFILGALYEIAKNL